MVEVYGLRIIKMEKALRLDSACQQCDSNNYDPRLKEGYSYSKPSLLNNWRGDNK
jgi:hypothetical protein